jgi:WD40 repeat protein
VPNNATLAPSGSEVITYIYALRSDYAYGKSLEELFRCVGSLAATRDAASDPPSGSPGSRRIVILGDEAGKMPTLLLGGKPPPIVVLRGNAALPDMPGVRRANVVADHGDVYQSFEKVCAVLGINVSTEVFLSYSRADSKAADNLAAALVSHGRRPWVDRRDLEASDEWLEALHYAIDASDSFLFLVSTASIASQFCMQELQWAIESGKRIIPVLLELIPSSQLPKEVAVRQYIVFAGSRALGAAVDEIIKALDRDPRIVRLHQQILRRALEWKRHSQETSLLLRGPTLLEAEDWLGAASARGEPRPTELQSAFIAASRESARQRRRRSWFAGSFAFLIMAGLAVWATFSAIEATRQRNEARSHEAQQNAFAALSDWERDPVNAYLHADAAVRTAPDSDPLTDTFDAMARNLLASMPETITNLQSGASVAAFSQDLTRIAFKTANTVLQVSSLTGPATPLILKDEEPFLSYRQLKFSADGTLLACLIGPSMERTAGHILRIWDTSTGKRISSTELALQPDASPTLVGFTSDDKEVMVEVSAPQRPFEARLLDIATGALARPPWFSSLKFLMGQLDSSLSASAEIHPAVGDSMVRVVKTLTGAPLWPPLSFKEKVNQVRLARSGTALAVVTAADGDASGSTVSSWVLNAEGQVRQVGHSITTASAVFVWDVARDGSAMLVLNRGADYPAEMWSPRDAVRATILLSKQVSSPFIMKTGEEYGPLSFVADDRYVLVRVPRGDPLEGNDVQQLLLFDRSNLFLAAAPFDLSLKYLAMMPAADSTRFAVVTHGGLVEQWDLLRHKLPRPRQLAVSGPLFKARFLLKGRVILTNGRTGTGPYRSQVDLWDVGDGHHIGRLPDDFGVGLKLALNATDSWLVTASTDGAGANRIKLWNLENRTELWEQDARAPVETVAFRNSETLVSTAGRLEDGSVVIVDYDVRTGHASPGTTLRLEPGSVHVGFSPDGEHLLADYSYASVLIWSVKDDRALTAPITFSDAIGLPFDLGNDILVDLHDLRVLPDGRLTGRLSGRVPVVVRREGPGTSILPVNSDTPVLSAYSGADSRAYPLRGNDMLSLSGRWFALASNRTSLAGSSGLRVFDFRSGYPITDWLIHQVTARPGEQWPRLHSRLVHESDPILAVWYEETEGNLVTVTTNGMMWQWPFQRDISKPLLSTTPPELPIALTGRRLVTGGYVQRMPEQEYVNARTRAGAVIESLRGHP